MRNQEATCPNCRTEVNIGDVADNRSQSSQRRANNSILEEPVPPQRQLRRGLARFSVNNATKTTKRDFLDLLIVEGHFYLPPKRNVNARFLQQFLAGSKKLLKVGEVQAVSRVWNFKTCTTRAVWQLFPSKEAAQPFFPDNPPIERVDKTFVFNVH